MGVLQHGVSPEIEPANYIQARDALSARRGTPRVPVRAADPSIPSFPRTTDISGDFE
jgi:hypothetical protein